MVRIFQRYIFLELIKTLVLAVATFSAIFFLVQSVVVWQKYGLSVGQLLVTMPFILPTILNYSLPMATLVTCTFAYGRLSADNEILAIQSAGIHLFPIVAPERALGRAGLWPLAMLHLCVGYLLTLFLVVHIYLATTGETFFTLYREIITGHRAPRGSRAGK